HYSANEFSILDCSNFTGPVIFLRPNTLHCIFYNLQNVSAGYFLYILVTNNCKNIYLHCDNKLLAIPVGLTGQPFFYIFMSNIFKSIFILFPILLFLFSFVLDGIDAFCNLGLYLIF